MHIIGAAKGPREQRHLLLVFQASLDLLDHVAQVAEQLVQQPGLVTEPSLVLGSTQNGQPFGLCGKWARVTHPNEEYVAYTIQRGSLGMCLCFCCRRDQMQHCILHLRRDISIHALSPRNFTEVEVPPPSPPPQFFLNLFPNLWQAKISPISRIVAASY